MSDFAWSEHAITHGHGMAFWYSPEAGLHWGKTHYMIFHDLFGKNNYENLYAERNKEQGIFGWIFPDAWGSGDITHPDYDISFGTDFGRGSNIENKQLEREAVDAVEEAIGYRAYDVFYDDSVGATVKNAGHSFETDDIDNAQADSIGYDFPNREMPSHICENCGSTYEGQICGDCGYGNLESWTPLNTFKGSIKISGNIIDGYYFTCFGFLNDTLYLGSGHHMAIMKQLELHGWTWDQLMNARQIWGWFGKTENWISITYVTDAGSLDPSLDDSVKEAFAQLTGISDIRTELEGANNEEYAPGFEELYGEEGSYSSVPVVLAYNLATGKKEIWGADRFRQSNIPPKPPIFPIKAARWEEDEDFEQMAGA